MTTKDTNHEEPTMKPTVTDKQMRDAWSRRFAARKALFSLPGKIKRFSPEQRASMARYEQIIAESSETLKRGLFERDGVFWLARDFPLFLGVDGDMVPVWPWLNSNTFYRKYRKALMSIVKTRSQPKRVAV
jgi:hypothetical protein